MATYRPYHLFFASLTLTSVLISRCIHIAEGGILSFFFWVSSVPLHIFTGMCRHHHNFRTFHHPDEKLSACWQLRLHSPIHPPSTPKQPLIYVYLCRFPSSGCFRAWSHMQCGLRGLASSAEHNGSGPSMLS